jgi:hypothetical protein
MLCCFFQLLRYRLRYSRYSLTSVASTFGSAVAVAMSVGLLRGHSADALYGMLVFVFSYGNYRRIQHGQF